MCILAIGNEEKGIFVTPLVSFWLSLLMINYALASDFFVSY